MEESSRAETDYYPRSLREKYQLDEIRHDDDLMQRDRMPAIDWIPDLAAFEKRSAELAQTLNHAEKLPDGWPCELSGPLLWSPDDWTDDEHYVYTYSKAEVLELENALARFKDLNLPYGDINRTSFPLPLLGPALERLSEELHEGRGFFVLKGLNPKAYSKEENLVLYLGISSYIAARRGRQNQYGSMITHITDPTTVDFPKSKRRAVYSTSAQPFHADVFCDVLSLFCLSSASKGGSTSIASSWTVYNDLASRRPDIVHTLSQDNWIFDTAGRKPRYHKRALLHKAGGRVILNFSRRLLTGSSTTPRSKEIPPMTEVQAEALDAVHFAAADNAFKLELGAGDICYINNLALLHSRDAFEDDVQHRRYLLRLWLNSPELGWQIPPGLRPAWDRIYEPWEGVEDIWDLDPFADPVIARRLIGGDRSSSCS